MQKESISKNKATDSLLETKLKTDENKMVSIKKGGLVFKPVIEKEYTNNRTKITPSLDGLVRSIIDNNETKAIESDEKPNDAKELSPIELRNIILSYFQSDEYYNQEFYKDDAKSISRKFEPMVVILTEDEDGSLMQLLVKQPFRQGMADELFKKIELKEDITITYNSYNTPIINIGDNSMEVTINNKIESMPIEQNFVSQLDETYCWEFLDKSPYHDWLKMSVDKFEEIDESMYKLTIKNSEESWILDNPEFWNESHDTVKLIEEFADGNPSLLENVFIRPSQSKTSSKNIRTKKNDTGWEMAIEKPTVKLSSKERKKLKRKLHMYMIAIITAIFTFSFTISFLLTV